MNSPESKTKKENSFFIVNEHFIKTGAKIGTIFYMTKHFYENFFAYGMMKKNHNFVNPLNSF